MALQPGDDEIGDGEKPSLSARKVRQDIKEEIQTEECFQADSVLRSKARKVRLDLKEEIRSEERFQADSVLRSRVRRH